MQQKCVGKPVNDQVCWFYLETSDVCPQCDISPTFPLFKLADCDEHIHMTIGPNSELFHSETGRWRQVGASVPRRLMPGAVVLYRAPQTYGQMYKIIDLPADMQDEMGAQSRLRDSSLLKKSTPLLKRKASFVEQESQRQVRPRVEISSADDLTCQSPPSTSFTSYSPTIDLTLHLETTSPSTFKAGAATIVVSKAPTNRPQELINQLSVQPLTPNEREKAHSAHARWPLMYFAPMLEGIRQIENNRGTGSELEKHKRAFPMSVGSATTMTQHMRYWVAAPLVPESLIDEFAVKPRSTWKEFCKAVERGWGTKLLKLKELNGLKKGKAKAEVAQVKIKDEVHGGSLVYKVKTEENDIIYIDSD
ncbi:hypothetical protein V5O48_015787 [Marasmius crinis-equi]|uniref:Uncharacterized protein n=1 Tax=Marasmius crinis-equi TaxID=585013 RepID=A0ABR3ETJ5_9AGAR